MLRTMLLVAIVIVVGADVLSEIGVNIAPLLAGAGVLGVAIGFGSQKLVQDLITGLFLLLENAMQVGDVVTLAGLSGTVEELSIRTIRLRALDGSVHIIPFSAVTTRDQPDPRLRLRRARRAGRPERGAGPGRRRAARDRREGCAAEPRWQTRSAGELD